MGQDQATQPFPFGIYNDDLLLWSPLLHFSIGLGKDDPRLALVGDRDATGQEQRSGAILCGSTRPDGGGGGGGDNG